MNQYPGYKAKACNGCGLCCLSAPCPISNQFNLWQGGRCQALTKTGDSYACMVLINPTAVSFALGRALSGVDPAQIRSAIGAGFGCDHRSAWSMDAALELLAQRNLADELFNNPVDTFPRAALLHLKDGRRFQVFQPAEMGRTTVTPISADGRLELEHEITLTEWRAANPGQ